MKSPGVLRLMKLGEGLRGRDQLHVPGGLAGIHPPARSPTGVGAGRRRGEWRCGRSTRGDDRRRSRTTNVLSLRAPCEGIEHAAHRSISVVWSAFTSGGESEDRARSSAAPGVARTGRPS